VAAPIAPIAPSMIQAPAANGPVTAGMLQLNQGLAAAGSGAAAPLATFQEFFADAIKQTSGLEEAAEVQQKRLLVGDTDNLHDVMIAMEKADMAFQLTLAVRNKVIDAYTSVMQMQM
jgi:flagellar hook-basal body complex protein FliE